MVAEPLVHIIECHGLTQKQQFARLHVRPRRQSIEVDPTGKRRCVEPHFVIPGFLFSLSKSGYLLAERVEDCEKNV